MAPTSMTGMSREREVLKGWLSKETIQAAAAVLARKA
jgi:hypothetical protein